MKIEKVSKERIPSILKQLQPDIVRHVFAVNDLQNDLEHTEIYAAFEDECLKGYLLVYMAADVPSVVLDCEEIAADRLLLHGPSEGFIVHAPLNLLHSIKCRFPRARQYVEDWMVVKQNDASFLKSEVVRKLRSKKDATELARLLSSRHDRPRRLQEKYVEWIRKMPLFGVFDQGRLISYAGSFIQLPQIWLIGGVYTHPEYRNRGYASLAASAITEQALKNAPQAGLLVRSDNCAAIKVYGKIGYRKIAEKVWVDVGTGLKP